MVVDTTAKFRVELRVLPATRRSGWADRRTPTQMSLTFRHFPRTRSLAMYSRLQYASQCIHRTYVEASVCHPHGPRDSTSTMLAVSPWWLVEDRRLPV
jgi:hypothetical protein